MQENYKNRLNKIQDAVSRVKNGDFTVKIELSEQNDEIDSLAAGFNAIIQNLVSEKVKLEYLTARIEGVLDVIQEVAKGEYSVSCETTQNNDIFDALAIGVNMMTEDIKNNVENIKKDIDIQDILNSILSLQIKDLSLENILEYSMQKIHSIPWLASEKKGAVFLVENRLDVLVMKTQYGLTQFVQSNCSEVKFGKCLCGRAALTGELQFADCIDERHDVRDKEMQDHGHYCVPIVSSGKVLGVINTCLRKGHKKNEKEEQFLKAVADVLAKIIENKIYESEKEKLQEKLIQSEKMSAVGKLASGVAHEINNPLTAILGYCQLLHKKTKEDNLYYKHLSVIEKQTVRCKDLVDELLLFSRMQKSSFGEVDLNKTVEEIIQIVRTKSKVSDVELFTVFDPEVLSVFGSKNQIQQVVANLCNNAIDAVPKGGKVWVRTKHFIGHALLEVEDNGMGIPENIKNQIFEPFFTTKEVGKGTGLGLSLTFEILKKHGFEISLESEVKKCTKFIVKMPYKTEIEKVSWDSQL